MTDTGLLLSGIPAAEFGGMDVLIFPVECVEVIGELFGVIEPHPFLSQFVAVIAATVGEVVEFDGDDGFESVL